MSVRSTRAAARRWDLGSVARRLLPSRRPLPPAGIRRVFSVPGTGRLWSIPALPPLEPPASASHGRFNANGVPVIVHFAHEMNGSWYLWGQQPVQYVETLRQVAGAVHRDAPGSAMMWAPNYGGGYPFAGGEFESLPGSPGFTSLDATGDGALASFVTRTPRTTRATTPSAGSVCPSITRATPTPRARARCPRRASSPTS
jgi:hypothetical protein